MALIKLKTLSFQKPKFWSKEGASKKSYHFIRIPQRIRQLLVILEKKLGFFKNTSAKPLSFVFKKC